MKIIAYECQDAPTPLRWLAVYLQDGAILPVRFIGPTQDGVTAAAQTFWDQEQQRIIDKGVKRQSRKPRAQPDNFDVI
jgi:hypothetical protein